MSISAGPKIIKDSSLVLNIDPSNYKSYPAAQDSNSNNISLMLDFDGANGSTTFTDKSSNGLTVTAAGNAQISTVQSKFGGSSVYFDGNDWIAIANNAVMSFGTGQFTIEFWIRLDSIPSSGGRVILYTGDSPGSLILRLEPSTGYLFCERNFYSTNEAKTNVGLAANTWTHVAVTRDSNSVMRIFIDGVQRGSATITSDYNQSGSYIGAANGGGQGLAMYIDDLCIIKGTAKFTSNFTPPSAPLFLPGRMTDLTVNRSIATFKNGPTYSSSNGGTIVFDGSNDYITAPTSTLFNFGSGDFTVSAWINMTSLPSNSYSTFITHGVNGTSQRWLLYYDTRTSQSSPGLRFTSVNASNGVNIDISVGNTTGWSVGAWYFVAITRVGNIFTLYRNGVQIGNTVTDTDSIIDVTSNGLYLGVECTTTDGRLNGKISLVQIYKGRGLSSSEMYNNFVANRGRFGV
jgi:hypothetical protein